MTPHRIELPIPFSVGPSVNAYLFTEPELTLVDCGIDTEKNWQALTAGLAHLGWRVADLARVVITHAHVDHMGAAKRICDNSDAEIWVSDLVEPWAIDLPTIWRERVEGISAYLPSTGLSEDILSLYLNYMSQIPSMWGSIPADRLKTFTVDGVIPLGNAEWQVLHMPGHTHTQSCFYQPESKELLSADMLLSRAPLPVIEFDLDTNQRIRGLPQFVESLAQLHRLDIDLVMPGHGNPFTNAHDVLERQRQRIEKRKNQCLDLLQDGAKRINDLTNIMYANYPAEARMAGLSMVIGYLDLLQDEGKVQQKMVQGQWYYHTTGR